MSTILVVDDSTSVVETIKYILEEADYDVIDVTSGEEAYQMLDTLQPDLLLTDIYLPGMDGIELIQSFHSLYPEGPAIAMSSNHGRADVLALVKRLGAAICLTKPFGENDLLRAVELALQSAGRPLPISASDQS